MFQVVKSAVLARVAFLQSRGGAECCNNPTNSAKSTHYQGFSNDNRSNNFRPEIKKLVNSNLIAEKLVHCPLKCDNFI